MKNTFFLSIALLLSVFFACKKENPKPTPVQAVVSGVVLQLNSTTPVPDATVHLYVTIYSGGLGGGSFTNELSTTTTNSKGEYSFTYTPNSNSEYFVKAYATNYFTDNNTRWTIESNKYVRNIIITPYAWITLRIINIPPVTINDFISVTGPWGSTQQFDKSGKCDTVFTKRALGNKKSTLGILFLDKNFSSYLDRIDSIFCKGLDTIQHTIIY